MWLWWELYLVGIIAFLVFLMVYSLSSEEDQ